MRLVPGGKGGGGADPRGSTSEDGSRTAFKVQGPVRVGEVCVWCVCVCVCVCVSVSASCRRRRRADGGGGAGRVEGE